MQPRLNDPYYHGAPNEEIGTKWRHMKVVISISISITQKKLKPLRYLFQTFLLCNNKMS